LNKKQIQKLLLDNLKEQRKNGLKELIGSKEFTDSEKAEILRRLLIKEKEVELRSIMKIYYHRFAEKQKSDVQTKKKVTVKDIFKKGTSEQKIEVLKRFMKGTLKIEYPTLLELLEKESDVFVLATIISALGNFKENAVADSIVMYLNHEDPRVRANSIDSLEKIGDKKYFKNIAPLIYDDDPRVKANAIRVMAAEIDPEKGNEALDKMMSSGKEYLKKSADYTSNKLKKYTSKIKNRTYRKKSNNKYTISSTKKHMKKTYLQKLIDGISFIFPRVLLFTVIIFLGSIGWIYLKHLDNNAIDVAKVNLNNTNNNMIINSNKITDNNQKKCDENMKKILGRIGGRIYQMPNPYAFDSNNEFIYKMVISPIIRCYPCPSGGIYTVKGLFLIFILNVLFMGELMHIDAIIPNKLFSQFSSFSSPSFLKFYTNIGL